MEHSKIQNGNRILPSTVNYCGFYAHSHFRGEHDIRQQRPKYHNNLL